MQGGFVYTLRARALRALNRREHSHVELEQKLAPHGTKQEITALLDELVATDVLSDARFVEIYISSRAARFGAAKLRYGLRNKGVSEALIEAALVAYQEQGSAEDASMGSEAARAYAVWQRKFACLPQDRNDYARQGRFLQSRGFSGDVIRRVLKSEEN